MAFAGFGRRCLPLGAAVALFYCGGESRPMPFHGTGGSSGGGGIAIDASGYDGPPPPDASGYCGNQVVPVVINRPNLYFIVDRSGSMTEKLAGTNFSKYENARIAIGNVLRAIGHRVNYGAAVFPSDGGDIPGCAAGKEVFKTAPGDPVSYLESGVDGPQLKTLLTILAKYQAEGGTPTASSIEALAPTLEALTGKTFVVLATDGAPNCNPNASCTAENCSLDIDGVTIGSLTCTPPVNCCDPQVLNGGQLECVDAGPTALAVSKLKDAGIPSYIVGMPGSEAYANVLDQLADAGGTARPTEPRYYSVSDADELSATLKQIGVTVAASCSIELESAPPDPKLVNVYFDTAVLAYDALDGWTWTSENSIEIHGTGCDKLKSGDVIQLQIVAGCPTIVK